MIDLSDLPRAYQEQAEAKLGITPKRPTPQAVKRKAGFPAYDGLEKDIYKRLNEWLRIRGYLPRTTDAIIKDMPSRDDPYCVGWYIHLNEAERNPILGDYLLVRPHTTIRGGHRVFEIEIKAKDTKISEAQKSLVAWGHIAIAWSFDEAVKLITGWEQGL